MPKGQYTRKPRNKKAEPKRVTAIRKAWKKKLADKNVNTVFLEDSQELQILFLLTHSKNSGIAKWSKDQLLVRALKQLAVSYGHK